MLCQTGCVTWFQILETNYRYGSYQDSNHFLVLYHYYYCSVSCISAITNVRSKLLLIISLVIRIYLFRSLFFFKLPRWCFLLSYLRFSSLVTLFRSFHIPHVISRSSCMYLKFLPLQLISSWSLLISIIVIMKVVLNSIQI